MRLSGFSRTLLAALVAGPTTIDELRSQYAVAQSYFNLTLSRLGERRLVEVVGLKPAAVGRPWKVWAITEAGRQALKIPNEPKSSGESLPAKGRATSLPIVTEPTPTLDYFAPTSSPGVYCIRHRVEHGYWGCPKCNLQAKWGKAQGRASYTMWKGSI
jgi:hypothetical protein